MSKFSTGTDVASALRRVASAIESEEQQGISPSASKISNTLLDISKHLTEGNLREAASGDPRWITAKYPGKTSDGTAFKKGDLVLYYPNTKTFLAGDKAKAEWRKFEMAVQDEDVYNKSASDEREARFEEGKPADPTKNMSPEDAKEWKVQNEENRDNFKTAAADAKVKTFLAIMSSYVTQQDQKEEKKNPNIYRLGLFLEALQRAEDKLHNYMDRDDEEAMQVLKAALSKAFNSNFPPLKKILKQIDEWQMGQKLPKLNKI
jgi:Ni/Co efflux regulator RcnB